MLNFPPLIVVFTGVVNNNNIIEINNLLPFIERAENTVVADRMSRSQNLRFVLLSVSVGCLFFCFFFNHCLFIFENYL